MSSKEEDVRYVLLQISPNLDDTYLKNCGNPGNHPTKEKEFYTFIGEVTSLVSELKLPITVCGICRSMLDVSGAIKQLITQTKKKLPIIIVVNTHGEQDNGIFDEVFTFGDNRIVRRITPDVFWNGFPDDWSDGDHTWVGMNTILNGLIVNNTLLNGKHIHIVFAQCHGLKNSFL